MTMLEKATEPLKTLESTRNLLPSDRDEIVRAVLTALHDPDDGLLLAICAEAAKEQVRPVAIHRIDAATLWQAGIDAILAEEPLGPR